MFVLTAWTQLKQGFFKLQQILPVLAAWPNTLVDFLSNIFLAQGAKKLRIVRQSNVDQTPYVWGGRITTSGRMERGVLDAVSINFSNVKILLDFLDSRRDDMISDTPDTISLRQTLLTWLEEKRINKKKNSRHTGSPRVFQKLRSIRVTTRPGASGVPRWSSLKLSIYTSTRRVVEAHLA